MRIQKIISQSTIQVHGGKVSCRYYIRYKKHWWNYWKYIKSNGIFIREFDETDVDAVVAFLKNALSK